MATIDDLIDEIERSYDELNAQLADPEVLGDRARYADAARAHAELQQVHELTQRYREAERTVADAEGLLGDDSVRRRDARVRAGGAHRGPPPRSTSSARRSACACSRATPTTPRT